MNADRSREMVPKDESEGLRRDITPNHPHIREYALVWARPSGMFTSVMIFMSEQFSA